MKKVLILLILLFIPFIVNANSGYLYDVLKNETESNGLAKEYTEDHHDSFTEEPSKKIYHWYAEDDDEGLAVLEKNNVIFANFCWQIIRTTDTGGVKLMYNGVPNEGKCNNTGEDTFIGKESFNLTPSIFGTFGYMYNSDNDLKTKKNDADEGVLFGENVTYENGTYTLTNTSSEYDNNHHYTCNNTTDTCENVRFYFYNNNYYVLKDGTTIDSLFNSVMNSDSINKSDSVIKTVIDKWYEENLINYYRALEETVYCSDRTIIDIGGFDSHGVKDNPLLFTGFPFKNSTSLGCPRETDALSTSNPKAKLKYSIALVTGTELILLNNYKIVSVGEEYWTITPGNYTSYSFVRFIKNDGNTHHNATINAKLGIRPALSLKQGIKYLSGTGSKDDPYITDFNPYHSITITENTSTDKVEVDVDDLTKVLEGKEIEFTIKPKNGYELVDVTIVDSNNTNIEYTTSGGKYTFTMPTTNVTITPTYREIYAFLEGMNQEYITNSINQLKFRSNMEYSTFKEKGKVYVDNELVDPQYYELIEGSTIVIFNEEYSKKLSTGNHTISMVLNEETITTNFSIVEEVKNPETNDKIALLTSVILIVIAFVILVYKNKKTIQQYS